MGTETQKQQTIAIIASGDAVARQINAHQLADCNFAKGTRIVVLSIKKDFPTEFFYLREADTIKAKEEAQALAELHTLIPDIKETDIAYKVAWTTDPNPQTEALYEARLYGADTILCADPSAFKGGGWAETVASITDAILARNPLQNQQPFHPIIETPAAFAAQSSAVQKRSTQAAVPSKADHSWEKHPSKNSNMKNTTAVRSFATLPHKVVTDTSSASPPVHGTPKIVSK